MGNPRRIVAMVLAALSVATPAMAQSGADLGPSLPSERPALGTWPVVAPGQFTFHWAVESAPALPGQRWSDWSARMDFRGAPIQRNMYSLYESQLGEFPTAGIHVVEADPDFYRRHMMRLREFVEHRVPSPTATGFGMLDIETWHPLWALTVNIGSNQAPGAPDLDFKDDWRDYIRQARPELLEGKTADEQEAIFCETYQAATRRFFLDTLNECKRLRPGLRWGYYLFPPKTYFDYLTDERAQRWRGITREPLRWLYEAQDAVFPDVYSMYYCVSGANDWSRHEEDLGTNTAYLRENIREAVAVANGKPVIAYVGLRYHNSAGPHAGRIINDLNLRQTMDVVRLAGANGIAWWDAIRSETGYNEIQQHMTTQLAARINAYVANQPWPGSVPGSGGGSGGGGSAGGGSGGGTGTGGGGSAGSGSTSARTGIHHANSGTSRIVVRSRENRPGMADAVRRASRNRQAGASGGR